MFGEKRHMDASKSAPIETDELCVTIIAFENIELECWLGG